MKRKMVYTCCMAMLMGLGACGNETKNVQQAEQKEVTETVYESQIMSLGTYKGLEYTDNSEKEPTDEAVEEEMNNILLWFDGAELTDESVKENLEFDTVEEFRADTRENLKTVYEQNAWKESVKELYQTVMDTSEFQIEQSDMDNVTQQYSKTYESMAKASDMTLEEYVENVMESTTEEFETNSKEAAKKVIEVTLIADAIIQEEGLNPEVSYEEIAGQIVQEEGFETIAEFEKAAGGRKEVMDEVKYRMAADVMLDAGTAK